MNLYYIANSIYQFAYALPVYKRIGGTFVVHNKKKYKHFMREMAGVAAHGENNNKSTPDIIIVKREDVNQLEGILFFLANTINPGAQYEKSITLFHEHGTSDKKYEGGSPIAIKKLEKYDYILLSGPKNKVRLHDIGLDLPESKMIQIGCLRFDDYLSNIINREDAIHALGIIDEDRPTILYAPTWKFGNGTFKALANHFIKTITKDYNLILRPHYHDRRYARLLYLSHKLLGRKNVYYSPPEKLILADTYAAFAASDLLISDMSSVIYEYLITGQPIILASNAFQAQHKMPDALSVRPHVKIYDGQIPINDLIKAELGRSNGIYSSLLTNCFYNTSGGAVEKTVSFIQSLKN